ncbi:hypothetical protein [Candidatus Phytoplasma pruni]|uniref:Transmembrane protein n=1 Tax=Candidatus Phytoplasma pruni TaxID=479893 RepID=A0A851HKN5_9MOLU|nr:hypothetical protein [Candidatus Phytoplasma pruni]NWN45989.1 hypothetical protein [Candidatus Phytoplasma pruni]
MFLIGSFFTEKELNKENLINSLHKRRNKNQRAKHESIILKSFFLIMIFLLSVLSVYLLKLIPSVKKSFNDFTDAFTEVENVAENTIVLTKEDKKEEKDEKGEVKTIKYDGGINRKKKKKRYKNENYKMQEDKITFVLSLLIVIALILLLSLVLLPSFFSYTSRFLIINAGLILGIVLNLYNEANIFKIFIFPSIVFLISIYSYTITLWFYYLKFSPNNQKEGRFKKFWFIIANYLLITISLLMIVLFVISIMKCAQIDIINQMQYFYEKPKFWVYYFIISLLTILPFSSYMTGSLSLLDFILSKNIDKKYEHFFAFALFLLFLFSTLSLLLIIFSPDIDEKDGNKKKKKKKGLKLTNKKSN